MTNICFDKSDAIKLIKALDISKAHGHDVILVKMIKICADSLTHLLKLIFQNSLVAGIFTNDWKEANIVPIHKKMVNKLFQITDQFLFCRYVVQIFEKLIFNELFPFFAKRNLLSKHQSDFRPGAFCIYQLLAITHDIFLSFESSLS